MSARACRAIFVIAAIVTALIAAWQSLAIPPPQFEPVGGARVPQAAAAIIVILGLAWLVRAFAGSSDAPRDPAGAVDRRGFAMLAAFLGTVTALATGGAGFALAAGAFLVVTQWLYRTSRFGWMIPAGVMVVAAVGLELLFTRVFVIDLTRTF